MSAAILLAAGIATFTGVQPQLAAGGGAVYVTFAAGDVISVARSTDAGATFASPVALPEAGRLALGKRRGPRVAATAQAVVVAAVAGARGGGADGDLVLYRSTDQGRTWTAPIVVNDVPGAAREGMHGLAANASGVVVLAWLDLRQKGTRIYAAVSHDHGATWSPDRLVYTSPSGSVCECCHPSVAVADDGRVAVMFRNHLEGRRDMYVVESRDGATLGAPLGAAVKQGRGSWLLEACPMDGGAVAVGAGVTNAVWRREATLYATVTRAPSVVTDPEVELGPGRDPVVARHDQRVDMAWTGPDGIVVRQAGGASTTLGPGGFASIVAMADHTLVAYEHQGRVAVHVVKR
jgi:BNR repeat-like domain